MVATEEEIKGPYDSCHNPSFTNAVATEILKSDLSSLLAMQIICQFASVPKHFVLLRIANFLSACRLTIPGHCHPVGILSRMSLVVFT